VVLNAGAYNDYYLNIAQSSNGKSVTTAGSYDNFTHLGTEGQVVITGQDNTIVWAVNEGWTGPACDFVYDVQGTGNQFLDGKFQHHTPKERIACPVLYKTLPVFNDGSTTVCCLDALKTTNMGNVFESSVHDVWHGEEFTKMRYFHETKQWEKTSFCEKCNGWAQYTFEEEIIDGILIRKSPEFTYYNKISRIGNWHENLLGGHQPPSQDSIKKMKFSENSNDIIAI